MEQKICKIFEEENPIKSACQLRFYWIGWIGYRFDQLSRRIHSGRESGRRSMIIDYGLSFHRRPARYTLERVHSLLLSSRNAHVSALTSSKWFSTLSFSPPSHLSSLSVSPPVCVLTGF